MSRPSRVLDVARYLVVKALAGRRGIVEAIYMYYTGNGSIAAMAHRLGVRKHQLRGYIQRVAEKAGSAKEARILVKHVAPAVLRVVRPIIVDGGSVYRCTLCGETFTHPYVAEIHVSQQHEDVVERCIDAVIDELMKQLRPRSNT